MIKKNFIFSTVLLSLILFSIGFTFNYEILTLGSACQETLTDNISSLFYNKLITGLTFSIYLLISALILRKKNNRIIKLITQQILQFSISLVLIIVTYQIKSSPCETITTGYPLPAALAILCGFVISIALVLKRRAP